MREMPREQSWLIALTALLALVLIGGGLAIVSLRADLDRLDRQVAALASGNPVAGDGEGWATDDAGWGTQSQPANGPSGYILGTTALSGTFQITLSLRFAGPGHLLYEPPILQGSQATYHPTQESLKQAHLDFLSLVTGGEATSALAFRPTPPPGDSLTLVFNPSHQAGDLVAPRWEMSIRGK